MSLVLDTGVMKYRKNPNQSWKPLVIKAGMNWESMADTYDPDNGTYEVGQYVLEEGMMYRCISEITTPEAWTPAHWTSVNVGDELSSFIIISDDQPTDETNKIWIAETTTPFGVQVPTMDDHNALGNTLNSLESDAFGNINLTGTNTTGSIIPAGKFFYDNGVLKQATTDIGIGAPVTVSNSTTITAGGLNALTVVTTGTVGKAIQNATLDFGFLRKVGNIVFASARLHTFSSPAIANIFTIPEGFRPKVNSIILLNFHVSSPSNVVDWRCLPAYVETNGNIAIILTADYTIDQIMFSGTWSVI